MRASNVCASGTHCRPSVFQETFLQHSVALQGCVYPLSEGFYLIGEDATATREDNLNDESTNRATGKVKLAKTVVWV